MVVEASGVLDLWTIFIYYVFGSFFLAVIGLALLMFVILRILGRLSIYTTTIYIMMFAFTMALGYGYILFTLPITIITVLIFFYSFIAWQGRK